MIDSDTCPKCLGKKNKRCKWCPNCKPINPMFKICSYCKKIHKAEEFLSRNKKINSETKVIKTEFCSALCKNKKASGYIKSDGYVHRAEARRYKKMGLCIDELSIYRKSNLNCEICNYEPKEGERILAADHCHAHGHFRGLLCYKCNCAIGLLKDDLELLEKAKQYLIRTGKAPSN